MKQASEPRLIRKLLEPRAYEHSVDEVRLLETHISWVILTGEFAYKLKKPLDLGFLDFSTLKKRKFYCEEELRLNRRLAPELYVDVVPITGDIDAPRMDGTGPALEYAVRMHQFPASARIDQQLGHLSPSDMTQLALDIATFHEGAEEAPPGTDYGSPQRVNSDMDDNFRQIAESVDELESQLRRLRGWHSKLIAALEPLIQRRRRGGRVRECHGDLHLTNLVRLGERIVAFDCIEFNPGLRFVDVMSEVAFLAMDLMVRQRDALAFAFISHYLERSGDYGGVRLLRLYMVYRSLVRAKVAAIRHAQEDDAEQLGRSRTHVELAYRLVRPSPARLVLMHGLSGSGKTWLSERLITALPALRVRSDVERKRLFGETSSPAAPGTGIYSAEHTRATYARLEEAARSAIESGFSIIVDAAFLKRTEREHFRKVARELQVDFTIMSCEAPEEVLRHRIRDRSAGGSDASDADLAVLDSQLENSEPITAQEKFHTVIVDTTQDRDPSEIAALS